MNLISGMHQATGFLGYMAEAALRALAVACITGLVLAVTPVRRAAARLYIWTGVLYVALAMPLLGVLLPSVSLTVPASALRVLQRSNGNTTAPPVAAGAPSSMSNSSGNSATAGAEIRHFRSHSRPLPANHASTEPPSPSAITANTESIAAAPPLLVTLIQRIDWKIAAVALYLAGLALLSLRLLLGTWASRRLARSAEDVCVRYFPRKGDVQGDIEDERRSAALDLLSAYSFRAGLKRPPRLKESAALSVPATIGWLRPVILLPPEWQAWTRDKLAAVLAHEVSHVARGDAWTQLLSLLHRAIFWFSPLAWWLNRQLSELAEQASDEAALAGGASRTLYAETLLGFFAQLNSAPGRVRWQALSMANRVSPKRAERRVDRILAWKDAASIKKPLVIALVAFAVPVIFLAASLRPFIVYAQSALTPSQPPERLLQASVLPRVAPAILSVGMPATKQDQKAPADQELLRAEAQQELLRAEAQQELLRAEQAQDRAEKERQQAEKEADAAPDTININGGFYTNGSRYVMMSDDAKSVSMSGSDEDLQHALRLHNKIKAAFIWFERDEKSYVITDPDFVARAKALFAPQEALGKKQDELGRQQDELGRQQDALGKQMDKITVKMPDITADLERIRARLKELETNGATQRELGIVQTQVGELQGRIGRLQSQAGAQQSLIGRQQGELGRKQGELGRQQGELGRQQGALARQASRELRGMFDDAIAKGIAKPE